jgi:hypothetical protein
VDRGELGVRAHGATMRVSYVDALALRQQRRDVAGGGHGGQRERCGKGDGDE